jgi:hypothetical protein
MSIWIYCWGIRNQAFHIPKIKECFQLPEVLCERLSGETPGVLESTFISQNQDSVRLLGFPHDETPEMNLTHPVRLSLGFAWVVSSSLTSNDFKFECDLCFRWRKVPGERGVSKRLKVFSRQAHVMTTRKALRFAAWHHEAPITWRPNWRFPKNSLAHYFLIRFTWGYSRNVKSLFASL